jgi:hypothetical protein
MDAELGLIPELIISSVSIVLWTLVDGEKRNTGVSPLRRAMKPHGSGRDDGFWDEMVGFGVGS